MTNRWNEEVWRLLVEAAPDAMVMVNKKGIIAYANAQTSNLFGYAHNELDGQPIEILLPERFRKEHVGQRDGYLHNPHVRPMGAGLELFGVRKDGSEFPVEISLSPLKTSSADLITAAIRDVSERKRVQEELKPATENG